MGAVKNCVKILYYKEFAIMEKNELIKLNEEAKKQYDELCKQGLKLDMSRGKPSPAQLDLSLDMLTHCLDGDYMSETGVDCRNYGVLDGIEEAKRLCMPMLGVAHDEIIIGGAPFNAEVERFLKQIGFPYTIAYGMTECGPIICSSRWETLKLASCGKATTRMEVKIDSSDPEKVAGEIICRGTNLMLGYYKNQEATSQIIDVNGWLHTGDLGTMDAEGYVTVRGRSKNMLLTSSGQNIYPEEIESKLNNMPYVSESLIDRFAARQVGRTDLSGL